MMNVDTAAYGEFSDPLYISIPFYYGLRGGKSYGVFLDNPAFPVFDVDSTYNGTFTFGALEGELDYYLIAGPELFIRWMQFGSFIPIFRNHATDTTPPREPWVFGEPYSTMAREIINRRYRLLPYLYTITEGSVAKRTADARAIGFPLPAGRTYLQPG